MIHIEHLETKLERVREKTEVILLDCKELVEEFNQAAINQARTEFKEFFTSWLKDPDFEDLDDGNIMGSWREYTLSLRILPPIDRFMPFLPAFETTFSSRIQRASVFDSLHPPDFDDYFVYNIKNQEHMLRCQIEKQLLMRVWFLLIQGKTICDLKVGYAQLLRFNPTNYGNIYSSFSDFLAGRYRYLN